VPSTFTTDHVFDVQPQGGGWQLSVRSLPAPFEKNYDLAESPLEWLRFDTSNWVLFSAFEGDDRLGGLVGAFDSPGVDMLEGRGDLAVVWDLRIAPHSRRLGVAGALLGELEAWAREKGCRELKVETQNTNVAACGLYRRHGFVLWQANRAAYPDYPDEVQLIWRKRLG
jgi:GNAT superfamily N-acetyltransferase